MRKNNFDLVRLLLAVIVVLVHCYDLSESHSLEFVVRVFDVHLAVEGFFAISGFLIFSSYERCSTLDRYFSNRAFRILPGYWLSTIFCLLIAVCFGKFHVLGFLVANLLFLNFFHPEVTGVFPVNPGGSALNGALWTIKIEVMFYLAVPAIVWCCRRTHRDLVLGTLFVCSILYRVALASHHELAIQLPGQLSYFLAGAWIYYHLSFFKRYGGWFVTAAFLGYGLHLWTGCLVLRPASVAILTLAACLLLPHVAGPTRWGDFSYGTYILHWPIIQLFVASGLFVSHVWVALLLCVTTVAAAACLSWFVVEKPSLAHSRSISLRRASLGKADYFPPAVP